MSHPTIITCAITGAETTRERQPNLPITPAEQARAAADAVAAGASIIHLHVREDDATPSQRPERFEAAIRAIREAAPGVVIQISTGGAIGESIENRARPLALRPEMASLNVGSMNFGDSTFLNPPLDVVGLAGKMREFGVMPEVEVYEVGHLEAAFKLREKGTIADPLHVQFVLGVPGGMSGDPRHLDYLVSLLPSGVHWGVAGVGRFQFPLAEQAIRLGGHVRVGFEDNIYISKGVLAQSNAQQVAYVAEVARQAGRGVATLSQTRKLLGLSA